MKKLNTLLLLAIVGLNNIHAATFSSIASSGWSTNTTWAVTGADADNIPDLDDDVTINVGHTVSLSVQSEFRTLVVAGTLVGNSQILKGYGDYTITGSVTGGLVYLIMAPTIFRSTPVYSNPGNWTAYADLTIPFRTAINKTDFILLNNSAVVTNLGSVRLSNGSVGFNASSSWVNGTNSNLEIAESFFGNVNVNCSASGNTMIYSGNATAVLGITYFNLTIINASTKVAMGNIVVQNDYTQSASNGVNTLNLNNLNLTIGRHYSNNSNQNITNQGTITFNGSVTQLLSRLTSFESFQNVVLNGTGTVQLNQLLNIGQSLTINSGTFDVSASNFFLGFQGNLVNNGTLNCRQGNITFYGSALQSISGTSNTQFHNLNLDNPTGVIINSPQSLTNVLTLTNGNFNSNGNFTLVSDASKTARIAPKGAGASSFTGVMTIQKFISGRTEGWHDLSSTVTSSTINDWDDEMYMSGIGAFDGIAGPAGVDGYAGNFYSVLTWDEPTSTYASVIGSSTPLVVGKGYETWFADDQAVWTAKMIDTKGVPNYGDQTINLSYSAGAGVYAGVNLVGNPFASSVNYASCTKTNVVGNILILDNSGNYTDYGASPVIPPNQGFWITASATGASLVVLESAKSTATATNYYRSVPNYGIKMVFSNPSLPYYNENTIKFESNSSVKYDRELDALYMKSPNKNAPALFMYADQNAKLITNAINSDEQLVTIPLGIYTPIEGTYYIEPNVLNTGNYNYAWIENTKTGKKYDLDGTISIDGNENETNNNYVLRLSKNPESSIASQNLLETDVTVFNTVDNVNVKANSTTHNIKHLSVYDVSGKLILERTNVTIDAGNVFQIDISNLAKGMYIINVIDQSNNSISRKIIR